jgi:hypothetical protein
MTRELIRLRNEREDNSHSEGRPKTEGTYFKTKVIASMDLGK